MSCRLQGHVSVGASVTLVHAAVFGQEAELDGYMRLKRAWNVKAMECGVPYTIVSQGAFSEWMVETCPFVHHDTRTIDVVGDDPEAIGCVGLPALHGSVCV